MHTRVKMADVVYFPRNYGSSFPCNVFFLSNVQPGLLRSSSTADIKLTLTHTHARTHACTHARTHTYTHTTLHLLYCCVKSHSFITSRKFVLSTGAPTNTHGGTNTHTYKCHSDSTFTPFPRRKKTPTSHPVFLFSISLQSTGCVRY